MNETANVLSIFHQKQKEKERERENLPPFFLPDPPFRNKRTVNLLPGPEMS